MKNILLLLLFTFTVNISKSQDTINFENGDKLIVKVVGVSDSEIRYKVFNSTDGKIFSIPNALVNELRYYKAPEKVKEQSKIDPKTQSNGNENSKSEINDEPEKHRAVSKDSLKDIGYCGFSFGSTNPLGEFASTNRNKTTSGYAISGLLTDISLGIKYNKYFGLATMFRLNLNKVDAQTLANQLILDIPDASSLKVNTTNWNSFGWLIGGYGSFPISKSICIETKALMGTTSVSSPEYIYTVTTPTESFWFKQHKSSSVAFAYLVGISYRINPGKHFCLFANIDYTGAKAKFTDVKITDSFGGKDTDKFSQPMAAINYSFGIGYRFAK